MNKKEKIFLKKQLKKGKIFIIGYNYSLEGIWFKDFMKDLKLKLKFIDNRKFIFGINDIYINLENNLDKYQREENINKIFKKKENIYIIDNRELNFNNEKLYQIIQKYDLKFMIVFRKERGHDYFENQYIEKFKQNNILKLILSEKLTIYR